MGKQTKSWGEQYEPEVMLAMAIIERAALDYIEAIKKENNGEIKKLEKFFKGKWFKQLCNLNPNYLMEQCKKHVIYEEEERERRLEKRKSSISKSKNKINTSSTTISKPHISKCW